MALRQKQDITQKLKLSPMQIQTVKMLELPALELNEQIKAEIDDNPALEECKATDEDWENGDGDFDGDSDGSSSDDGGNFDDDGNDGNDYDSGGSSDDSKNELAIVAVDYDPEDEPRIPTAQSYRENRNEYVITDSEQSLSDYLLQQLGEMELTDRQLTAGKCIIFSLDDDGMLRRELQGLSDDIAFGSTGLNISLAELEEMLAVIQDFDPPGIGARSVQERLILQLKKRDQSEAVDLATVILGSYFDEYVNKRYDKIEKALEIDDARMTAVVHEIKSLTPHPGSRWANLSDKNHITPDFVVETNYEEITAVELNNGDIPVLRLNRDWVNRLRDYGANKLNDDAIYYKQKIEAAQGFIDAVKQRQETLLRTMKTIVQMQREFFLTGDESKLRPMILKDVAERTGYDISTISRVSASKYVETPFGVYLLKHFFSEATQTESGETVSSHKIRHIIKTEIDGENKEQPITDDELTVILNAKGFIIARRTVAKYREKLGIPIARMRKESLYSEGKK